MNFVHFGTRVINLDNVVSVDLDGESVLVRFIGSKEWFSSQNDPMTEVFEGDDAAFLRSYFNDRAYEKADRPRWESPRVSTPDALMALIKAAKDTIAKIDFAADERMNFRRDFRDRLVAALKDIPEAQEIP